MRIKAVTSIYKITKAMKMVSASKMKGDLARLDQGKDFAHQSVDMIFKCDTYMQRKLVPETSECRELIVPITSDRGLCGGINSGVIREIKAYLQTKNRKNIGLFVIGEKGAAASYRPFPDIFLENVQKMSHPVNFAMTMALGSKIQALSSDKDKIVIIYNRFKSAIQSELRRIEIMSKKRFMASMKFQKLYEMEVPDASTVNPALYDLYVASNLFHAQLQNAAAE
jgi:F-type H+-transporting ATPase subunit gamma